MRKTALLILIITLAITGCNTEDHSRDDYTSNGAANGYNGGANGFNGGAIGSIGTTDNLNDDLIYDKEYGVGETVEVNEVKVTFESIEMSYGDRDKDYSFYAPDEGKVFAVCNFLIENNSKKDLFISSLYFRAYEDGFAVDPYMLTDGIGVISLIGTVFPGKNIKGALVYEVSEDFQELELQYQPNILNDKKIIFLYTK